LLSQYHIVFYYIYIISYHIIVGEHLPLEQVLLTAPGDPSHDQVAYDSFRQATSQRADWILPTPVQERRERERRGRRDTGAESQQARPSERGMLIKQWQLSSRGDSSAVSLPWFCVPQPSTKAWIWAPLAQIHGRLGRPPAHNAGDPYAGSPSHQPRRGSGSPSPSQFISQPRRTRPKSLWPHREGAAGWGSNPRSTDRRAGALPTAPRDPWRVAV
jgi:hypothetical protein